MANLFMCSTTGGTKKKITRYKDIFSRTLSATTNSALDIRSYIPEGVDYTKLTVDNFVIDSIKLDNLSLFTESSNITETFAVSSYSSTGTTGLVRFTKYDNTTGKLTLQVMPPTLMLGGSDTEDVYGVSMKNSSRMKVIFSVGLIV